jgi:hypothetical protein
MDINNSETLFNIGKLVAHLEHIAKKSCLYDRLDDDNLVVDYIGSNVDDAYEAGIQSGEILQARELLTMLDVNWQA